MSKRHSVWAPTLKFGNIFSPFCKHLLQSMLSVSSKSGLGAREVLLKENQQFMNDRFKQQTSEMPTLAYSHFSISWLSSNFQGCCRVNPLSKHLMLPPTCSLCGVQESGHPALLANPPIWIFSTE